VKLLLTSAGIKNPSINDAMLDLLGKPVAECDALCIPTASYGHTPHGFRGAYRFIPDRRRSAHGQRRSTLDRRRGRARTSARVSRNVARAGGCLTRRSQKRLATDREDQDAQEACHVLGQGRRFSRLQEVVEEEEIHGEKPHDQRDIQYSSHAWSVDRRTSGSALGERSSIHPEPQLVRNAAEGFDLEAYEHLAGCDVWCCDVEVWQILGQPRGGSAT
jgi:hypothetical protein